MNTKEDALIQQARKIYTDNKNAIDFIVKHGQTNDLINACEQVFKSDKGEKLDFTRLEKFAVIKASIDTEFYLQVCKNKCSKHFQFFARNLV